MLDTIVAPATAPGLGALAIVRWSGPDALPLLDRLLSPGSTRPADRVASLRTLLHPESEELLDRGIVVVFPGPGSYTGEDMVEVTSHGGYLTPELIVQACVEAGARRAEPGEFTRRAYLNGRLDLTQAEAVADLVEGRAPALRRAALLQVEGGLSRRLADFRSGLVDLEAQLVHHLDFPEEDDPPIPLGRIAGHGRDLAGELEALLLTAPGGVLLREGALTVLAGRPNAGKSSLFNALLGEERAIVTGEPGTTRDAVDAVTSIGGFPFRVVDTAGVRSDSDAREVGQVERLGVEVARRFLAGAHLVLYCLEAGRALDDDEMAFLTDLPGDRVLLVRTRSDEVREVVESGFVGGAGTRAEVSISVRTGKGLPELKELMQAAVFSGVIHAFDADVPVVVRARQARAMEVAIEEVRAFAEALEGGVPGEVASAHLRSAESALEEMVGVIGGEEVLDRVFSSFCIGK